MDPEVLKTLELLGAGKISAAEALGVIESMEGAAVRPVPGRRFRIRVYRGSGLAANIYVPLDWAKFLAPLIEGKIQPMLEGRASRLDITAIRAAIERGEPGMAASAQDGGDKVEVFIE